MISLSDLSGNIKCSRWNCYCWFFGGKLDQILPDADLSSGWVIFLLLKICVCCRTEVFLCVKFWASSISCSRVFCLFGSQFLVVLFVLFLLTELAVCGQASGVL